MQLRALEFGRGRGYNRVHSGFCNALQFSVLCLGNVELILSVQRPLKFRHPGKNS
jgi:hypothetical protein